MTLHGWTLSPRSTAPTNSYERWPRSRCSGRRPGRRAGDTGYDLVGSAVNVAAEQLVGPLVGSTIRDYGWVFEADITACFDEINHQALLDRVRRRISDKKVLGLVKAAVGGGGGGTAADGFAPVGGQDAPDAPRHRVRLSRLAHPTPP
ncbi:MAG: hypothetical protein WAN44_12360 [Propionibacteriaceae bacterium]